MPLTVVDRCDTFRKVLDAERASGRRVGLVPTMGALHAGHLSLIGRAAQECDAVAVTLFVNPLQFGPSEDLAAYPRDHEGDRTKAADAGASYLFAPAEQEMFPEATRTTVRVGQLSERYEGEKRPGHLDGVATIVTKLLSLAGPCTTYFGEKDFQQLTIVRQLVRDLSLPARVVGCATVREPDGLALSSRNAYLSAEERLAAPVLHRALRAGRDAIERDRVSDPAEIQRIMAETVGAEPHLSLDYAEVVRADDLSPLASVTGDVRLLIAARFGRGRLIDNMGATA